VLKQKWSIQRFLFSIKNAEVLCGANFAPLNGIGNHIHSLKEYSSHKIHLFPSDNIMRRMSPHNFTKIFEVVSFSPAKKAILHSHVYPWYIKWCEEQHNKGYKWIHTYHAPYQKEYGANDILEDWQEEFNKVWIETASNADIRISVSKWQQEYYKKNHDIDTIYIPNGVDLKKCDESDPDRFISSYGSGGYILNVSRHDPVKNAGEFLQLAHSMPEYEFLIIGPGFTKDIFRDIYDLEVPENFHIYGPANHRTTLNAISACSVLVSTSKKEGLPTLVLEGMALSKPVVVSNEPGSMEVIDQGAYGYFYELGNITDLKDKVQKALLDKDKVKAARHRVLEEYDWRVVSAKLDSVYEELRK